jgi:hypothetical protein
LDVTGPRESFLSKLGLAVIAPVLVILLAGGSSPWWLPVIFPSSSPRPTAPTHSTSQTTPRPTSGASGTLESSGPIGDCVITVKNPFVDLHEDPEPFSQVIIQVPPGDYAVSDTAQDDFAGGQQRWLQITAEARTGWIEDNSFNVEAKSAGCD